MRPSLALASDSTGTRYDSETHAEGMLVQRRARDNWEMSRGLTGSPEADTWSWGSDVQLALRLRFIPTARWDDRIKPLIAAGMRGQLVRVWPDRDGQPSTFYDCYLVEPGMGRYGELEMNGRKALSLVLRTADGGWIPLYG